MCHERDNAYPTRRARRGERHLGFRKQGGEGGGLGRKGKKRLTG